MKRKIIVSLLGMTMAVAMMTGCGSGSSTKTADSTAVESEEVQVADAEEVDSTDDASDTEEATNSDDTGVSEEATDEPAEAEPTEVTVEGLDEKPFEYKGDDTDWSTLDKMYNFLQTTVESGGGKIDARDANGNPLRNEVSILPIMTRYIIEGAYMFNVGGSCEDFAYVDVDGERWIQYTLTVPEDAKGYMGEPLPEHEDTYVFTYSPDFTKMMYKGVIYTRQE